MAYNSDLNKFLLEFTMPVPEGFTEEEALAKHRAAKCTLEDGKLKTALTLSHDAFMAMMQMGCDIANAANEADNSNRGRHEG